MAYHLLPETEKPLIGISANFKENNSMLASQYSQSVIFAGGVPIIIPVNIDDAALTKIVRSIDGLIVSGGSDINPEYFNEKPVPELGEVEQLRDEYDVKLINIAHNHQLPILGICRGMQVLNVVFGGSLYQDIAAQYDGFSLKHNQEEPRNVATQTALIREGSLLQKIVGTDSLSINSIHHQAVKRIAAGFAASAFTQDGICEAIESSHYAELGVQWHPEHLAEKDTAHLNIFKWLVEEATKFNKAKNIHQNSISADSHCDTPIYFKYGIDLGKRDNDILLNPNDLGAEDEDCTVRYNLKVDFEKMREGRLDCVMMAAYIPQGKLTAEAHLEAVQATENILKNIHKQVNKYPNVAQIAVNRKEICEAKKAGKIAVVPVIENGYAIGENIDNIEKFHNLGVRYITLCHNGDNLICDSAQKTQSTNNGLSNFGRKTVQKMNELGIIVDVSHASEKTFWDVLEASTEPVIASHSCCHSLCPHPRNLTDEQLKALAQNGGVCQICLYQNFLTALPYASIETLIEHIKHVAMLVGSAHVGIGSDFDGGGEILGCSAANEFINITKALIKHGFSNGEIEGIIGGNLMRIMVAR
jgi:microsomal dipeptidase-like Zn-dependent dipeptidase/gamma-glutamyl-gamma-aminobutyrate hydrolase PuuD